MGSRERYGRPGTTYSFWTADEDRQLRAAAAEGLSAIHAAEILQVRSREACVCRARILGFTFKRFRGEWPQEREEMLRKLIEVDKLPTQAICARMGLTRNAVIGKAHRMGMQLTGVRSDGARRRGPYKGRAALDAAQEKQGTRPGLAPPKTDKPKQDKPLIENEPVLFPPGAVTVPTKNEKPEQHGHALPDAVEVDGVSLSPLCASLMLLKSNQCRFPLTSSFCGEPRIPGASYCAEHFAITRMAVRPSGALRAFVRQKPISSWHK